MRSDQDSSFNSPLFKDRNNIFLLLALRLIYAMIILRTLVFARADNSQKQNSKAGMVIFLKWLPCFRLIKIAVKRQGKKKEWLV